MEATRINQLHRQEDGGAQDQHDRRPGHRWRSLPQSPAFQRQRQDHGVILQAAGD